MGKTSELSSVMPMTNMVSPQPMLPNIRWRPYRSCWSPREVMTAESARAMAGDEKNSPMMTRRRMRKNTWGQGS